MARLIFQTTLSRRIVLMKDIVGNKIVLIGAGDVGVAYAYALVNQGTCDS